MTKSRGVADWGHYPPVNNNILINPSFTVKQRGDVIDHNSNSYGPDRWQVRGVDVIGGTMSQSTTVIDPTTGTNKLVVKHRNATSNAYTFQYIEAVNLLGLYGKEMTFSFSYSDVGGSGIPKVWLGSWNSSVNFKELINAVPTSLGDNRWSCTFTLSTTDGTFPDPSEIGMQVYIYANEKNAAPAEWSVWETKLEVGSLATPFIARSYGEELALCQRYYYQLGEGLGFGSAQSGSGANTYLFAYAFKHPVPMRVVPSLTLISGVSAYFTGGMGVTVGTPTGDSAEIDISSMVVQRYVGSNVGVSRLGLSGFTFNRGQGYGCMRNLIHCEAEL
jgi:hypothetical protein